MTSPRLRRVRTLALAGALLGAALAAAPAGAARPRWQHAEQIVTAIVPWALPWQRGTWPGSSVPTFAVDVARSPAGSLVVGGREDWRTAGLPSLLRCRAWRPEADSLLGGPKERIRLVLVCPPDSDEFHHLHFYAQTTDWAEAFAWFDQLVVPGEPDSAAVRDSLRETLAAPAAALFPSSPAAAAVEPLIAAASRGARSVERITYRDQPYLSVDLGTHGHVFNTVQLGRNQRIVRVLLDQLLPVLRDVAATLPADAGLAGLRLAVKVDYRNFVQPGNAEAGADGLELFAPLAAVTAHRRDEISAQQLLAASVLRLDGSRYDVDLSRD